MAFTEEEIELLMDGLDFLDMYEKNASNTSKMIGNFLNSNSSMIADHLEKQDQQSRLKRERIILLKAKLVHLKDKTFIDDLTGE